MKFLEVFEGIQLQKDLKEIVKESDVLHVTSNRTQDSITVTVTFRRLIPKKEIFRLEESLSAMLSKQKVVSIQIIERFQLSAQYTVELLTKAYWDSILEFFQRKSPLIYSILKNASVTYPQEHQLCITLEDTFVAHQREEDIFQFLYKTYNEKCGIHTEIEILYEEKTESKYIKNSKIQLENEISHITKRLIETKQKKKEAAEHKKSEQNEKENSKKIYKEYRTPVRSSTPADVIYGRDFTDDAVTMNSVQEDYGDVVFRGKIFALETRELRNGRKTIVTFNLTDFTDSFTAKIFITNEKLKGFLKDVKVGGFYKIKGSISVDKFDHEATISHVEGLKKIPDFTTIREDHAPVKRVELHCHTKMSDMDGVSEAEKIIERADSWGHQAIAITDHGNVQGFTNANHAKIGKDFKIIYGMEAYIVDDTKGLVQNPSGQSFEDSFVVFDLETTGFSPKNCMIIEIGAVKVQGQTIVDRFSTFVNPRIPIPYRIEELTSISDNMVMNAPTIEEILPEFLKFCQNSVMVAHNADFDMSFLHFNCKKQSLPIPQTVLDTVTLAQFLIPDMTRYKLDTLAKRLGIVNQHHHRAVDDAEATAEIFMKLVHMLKERQIFNLDELAKQQMDTESFVRKAHPNHAIMLALNDVGRVNLYKLVSDSHLKYFYRTPRIPKTEFMKYREGILLGSACEAGELYSALVGGRSDEEITRIVEFYDYLEIQPLGNNAFMIDSDRYAVSSMEEIKVLNQRVVDLGRQFKKPVVATCDVHFLDPEDEIYRRIIIANKFKNSDQQAPLYLRTTDEMLKEFEYLGSDIAEEVVITNTNRIADMCEKISPVRPDKCPPIIEKSDRQLRDICYNKAHELYGPTLPDVVVERLERELTSIISNGFAVMYIIAQKLVWKSNEDGYLVGSRGSVGSSFVATMAGITEVNPLSPHYLCPNCFYVDFDSEEVKQYAGRSGCDMPDKICPVCGKPLNKEGFDIPFETFLGFKGNKEPDIDLNFSGDYQSKAHKYTEVIFGDGQTFRAGTIGTLAEKTAFGYVKNYYEERNRQKRKCEIERLLKGCVDVRRTTGQHPGGIIVLPLGENIYSFTPIQHPANDMSTDIITTHFDYHSIDHNLLKLDILGHDDPTMIRMLQDLTGIDPLDIPLDNKEVMSLFQNTKALKVEPEEILGCKLGALGIPEFGTDFAMQMLIDTQPKAFSDLVRIAGLSHGTDVWLGNAKTLLEEGKATISTAICTRDDIMIYLIQMGLESELSFTIMEKVRKGKGLQKEWETEMRAHGVPEWYIWSCNKIKYMFPKAHAVAYVMMAWRIAYCKVFYPLAYYAAFFSIRAKAFSYELMCLGKERLEHNIAEYSSRKDEWSNKDEDTFRDMRIVQEMYARGFEFAPLDLYKAKARHFQIIDHKIMPSINSIDGMGDNTAEQLEEAAKHGPFLSKEDLKKRAKVSTTTIESMSRMGLLEDLSESNQYSIFDL